MIKPTIGRVVWYHPDVFEGEPRQTLAAIVCDVHSDTSVNLAVFKATGAPVSAVDVTLYQGEGDPPSAEYCEWMPYQIGQAAKTAEVVQNAWPIDAEKSLTL